MSEIFDITDRNSEFSEQTLRSQASGKTASGNKLNFWALVKENYILLCDEKGIPSAKAFDHRGGLVPKKDDRGQQYYFGVVNRNGKWIEVDATNSPSLTEDEISKGRDLGFQHRNEAVDRALKTLEQRYGHPVLAAAACYWCNRLIPRGGKDVGRNTELSQQNAAIANYYKEHQAAQNIEGAAQLYSDLKYINEDANAGKDQVLLLPEDMPKWLSEEFVLAAERSGNIYDSLINRIELEQQRNPSNEELLGLAKERLKIHEQQVMDSGSLKDKTSMFLHTVAREGLDKVDPELFNSLQLDMSLNVTKNRYFNPSAKPTTVLEDVNPDDPTHQQQYPNEYGHLTMQDQASQHGQEVGLLTRSGKYQQAVERRRIYPHLVKQVRNEILELLRQRGQEFEPNNPAAKPMNYHDWVFAQDPQWLAADVDRIYQSLATKSPQVWSKPGMAWIVNYVVNSLVQTRSGKSDLMALARANQPTTDATFMPSGADDVFLGD